MATHPVPAEHRFFIAREDWRDATKYPPTDLQDPSVGAWELLRRNNQYAQDFADWHLRVTDVPPVPFPKMSLQGYFCVPAPSPDTTYEQYRTEHPYHLVLPLLDHVRERWGITRLIDPTLTAAAVADLNPTREPRNKLAWLFACTTPEILNPPTHWPKKNYLTHLSVSMLASGFCTGTEVMVRLDFTGNFEAQVESLRRQIGAFFDNGTRSGSAVVERKKCTTADDTGQLDNSSILNTESLLPFRAVKPNWNTTPAKLKSIHGITRMADVIASLEAGTLEDQIREKRSHFPAVDISDLDLSIDPSCAFVSPSYIQEHWRVRKDLNLALNRYFKQHPFEDGRHGQRLINQWLDHAYQLVCGDHVLVARLAPPRPRKK
ncbi:transcriptional regulator domain-containing protein [Burkholderia gladioli]|uniref:transcriptional regulator domain-containing protein n=1 Tax=Burkholderia gladioli TaxID=28095 RepID=UPI001642135E|nr:hypothetical protein [Burkholderia gladioli]